MAFDEVMADKVFWQCNHKFDGGKKCTTPHLNEKTIKQLFIKALNIIGKEKDLVRVCVSPEDWIRIENPHELLVDRETWDLVQGHINSRKRSRKDDEPQIFAGMLKCSECGWSLSAANTKDKSRHYRCTQYSAHGKEACSLHFIIYNLLYAFGYNTD